MNDYKSLLFTEEWRQKRLTIIKRDENRCTHCNNESLVSNLNCGIVHFNNKYHYPSVIKNEIINLNLIDYKEDTVLKNEIKISYINPNIKDIYVIYYQPIMSIPSPSSETDDFFNRIKNFYVVAIRNNYVFSFLGEPVKDDFLSFLCNEDIIKLKGHISSDTYSSVYSKDYKNFHWHQTNGLHVHHTFYQEGKKPWEYPSESLITYCWVCHENLHKEKKVPYLNKNGIKIGEVTPCYRCNGAGEFPQYYHVDFGICFRCHGAKYEEFIK